MYKLCTKYGKIKVLFAVKDKKVEAVVFVVLMADLIDIVCTCGLAV